MSNNNTATRITNTITLVHKSSIFNLVCRNEVGRCVSWYENKFNPEAIVTDVTNVLVSESGVDLDALGDMLFDEPEVIQQLGVLRAQVASFMFLFATANGHTETAALIEAFTNEEAILDINKMVFDSHNWVQTNIDVVNTVK